MAIKKKTVKKGVTSPKKVHRSSKVSKNPLAKIVNRLTAKAPVKKAVVKSKRPSAKAVSPTAKNTASKSASKTSFIKRILTAEGWKRMMTAKRKTSKSK